MYGGRAASGVSNLNARASPLDDAEIAAEDGSNIGGDDEDEYDAVEDEDEDSEEDDENASELPRQRVGIWYVHRRDRKFVRKFGTNIDDYTFVPNTEYVQALISENDGFVPHLLDVLDASLVELVQFVKQEVVSQRRGDDGDAEVDDSEDRYYASIVIQTESLEYPIRISWMPVREMDRSVIFAAIERVLQSHRAYGVDENLRVNVLSMERPRGGAPPSRKRSISSLHPLANFAKSKGYYCPPLDADDNLCAARCILYYMASTPAEKRRKRQSLFRDEAKDFSVRARVNPDRLVGVEELSCFQNFLRESGESICIRVFRTDDREKFFDGGYKEGDSLLPLLLCDGHYCLIRSVPVFLRHKFYCEPCDEPYRRPGLHKCTKRCKACFSFDCSGGDVRNVKCDTCNFYFFGARCYSLHLGSRSKKCVSDLRKCHDCGSSYTKRNKHLCGSFYCKICERMKPRSHLCFIPVKKFKRYRSKRTPARAAADDGVGSGEGESSRSGGGGGDDDDDDDDDDLDVMRDNASMLLRFLDENESDFENRVGDVEQDADDDDDEHAGEGSGESVSATSQNRKSPYEKCDVIHGSNTPEGEISNGINLLTFDIETHQESGRHVPMMLVSQTMYGEEEKIFEGRKCVKKFLEYVFERHTKGVTLVAHNMKGFDGVFLVTELLNHHYYPKLILNGGKIMYIELNTPRKIRVVDSLNFIATSLSQFPSMFGLSLPESGSQLAKGYFPHLFNTRQRWKEKYVGPIPEPYFYGHDGMFPEAREKFLEWYTSKKADADYVFDLREETRAYCSLDVTILRLAMLEFMKIFQKCLGFNPLVWGITLASVCNSYYRGFHMPKDTIAYVRNLERTKKAQSASAIRWLSKLNFARTASGLPPIRHALNGGELSISVKDSEGVFRTLRVDGVVEEERTVFEFHGCFFHGCPRCFVDRSFVNPMNKKNVDVLLSNTRNKTALLESGRYKVIEMWECEWNKEIRTDPELKKFVDALDILDPLRVREAFYGGRCECVKMYASSDENHELKYKDVASLYPFCNENRDPSLSPYPIGHPIVFSKLDGHNLTPEFLEGKYGFCLVDVLPPRELRHPVLPIRENGKLMFALCRRCAKEGKSRYCPHTDEERVVRGTWPTEEVKLAVEKGYKIVKVHEVVHFEKTSRNLFSSYVQKFKKMKVSAEGWPHDVDPDDPDQRAEYIFSYHLLEAIQLIEGEISKNPQLRKLAKMCLNTLWGKFGQKPNKCKVLLCSTAKEWFDVALDVRNDVQRVLPVGKRGHEHALQVYYTVREEFLDSVPEDKISSPVVAAWTTFLARRHLYRMLDKLGDRVLYMDTDSVVYVQEKDRPDICPTGKYFGEWTDEIPVGKKMSEFVGAGPKNYGYRLDDSTSVLKVRGMKIDYRNSREVLNLDNVKRMMFGVVGSLATDGDVRPADLSDACNEAATNVVTPHSIVPHRPRGMDQTYLASEDKVKKYAAVLSKRMSVAVLMRDGVALPKHQDPFDTLPFGTCRVE